MCQYKHNINILNISFYYNKLSFNETTRLNNSDRIWLKACSEWVNSTPKCPGASKNVPLSMTVVVQPAPASKAVIEIFTFDFLEISDSADPKLQRRVIIADNHGFGMQLEAADRPHLVNPKLDNVAERPRLMLA